MVFRAFLDANIIVPARYRDILLTLAEAGLYKPLWSQLVLDEVARHLPESMTDEDRRFLFQMMNEAFPEALVTWPGFVDLAVRAHVNEKDRHIVAAALWGRADLLLSLDATLRQEVIASRLVEAQSMPEFITSVIDTNAFVARTALITMARRRWGVATTSTDTEILKRFKSYFHRHGWSISGL